jgi:hypothetical protein
MINFSNRRFTGFFNDLDPTSFQLSAIDEVTTLKFVISPQNIFSATSQEPIQIIESNKLKLISGKKWGEVAGFMIGDVFRLTYNDGGSLITGDATIINIQDDILTHNSAFVMHLNAILPSGDLTSPVIRLLTYAAPQRIEVFANLVANSSAGSVSSLLDNEVNRFIFDGAHTVAVSGNIAGVQLGDKSGGAIVESNLQRLTDISGRRVYEVTLSYYNWLKFENDAETPPWFFAAESIKPFIKCLAHRQANNPNAFVSENDNYQLGNVGYYNEKYSQGVTGWSIDSVSFSNNAGDVIPEIDPSAPTNIEIQVSHNSSPSSIDSKMILSIYHLPFDDYKNKATGYQDNILLSVGFKSTLVDIVQNFGVGGAQLVISAQDFNVTGGVLTYTCTVTPNSAFTSLMASKALGDKLYRVSLTVQAATVSATINDRVSLLCRESQYEIAPIQGGVYPLVESALIYNHFSEIGVDTGSIAIDSMTEDDLLYRQVFNLEKSQVWDGINIKFIVRRISDGAMFNLFNLPFGFTQFVTSPNGTQNININQALNYELPNPLRNFVRVQLTGNSTSTTYEVELLCTFLLNWEYWKSLNSAFVDFFDATLANNGMNQEWVRYTEAGYEFLIRTELMQQGVVFHYESPVEIADYDSTDIVSSIELYRSDLTTPAAAILEENMLVRGIHENPVNWEQSNTWGWIAIRNKENEPRRLISTKWDWTAANLPLRPKSGETRATLTFPTAQIAHIECMVDGMQVSEEQTIITRIQDPAKGECLNPISILFQMARLSSDNPKNQLNYIKTDLLKGFVSDAFCAPECENNDGNFVFALGSRTKVNSVASGFDPSPCCRNYYAETESLISCTMGYNNFVDNYLDTLTGDKSFFLTNSFDEVNRYGTVNIQTLFAEVDALFPTISDRLDLLEYIVTNGMKIETIGTTTTISIV